jgi:2-(1,2-epoxy-1,2-dihydrophenyl)acetyl-CoA isomerase
VPAIRSEAAEGVLTLTLDRPDALNAFDGEMKEELLAAFRSAERDRAVRALVLTGAGRAFSAGQDLKERRQPGAADLARELRERYNPIILAMRRLEKPIVAAVNGVAAGAGFSLALACDLVVAAEGARFIQSFTRVGLVPDTGSTWFLPRLVGYHRAAELALLADPLDAAEAQRLGIVNRVVPADALRDEAASLARRLADCAPLALALTKRALIRGLEADLASQLDLEAQLQGVAGGSADHTEGVAAFVEKRAPRFRGG